ncbi:LysR family transcriptional regulator [Bradyrhizobium commune]|uniref:LysR family transcriptional regulator n=1 Tax=Bradyrhizobium commune TaxID=83627 RepID=A0A7S9D4G8_9BRAD|nr:LysR family transcriptional regulator [Bradyrhizobium commune]QPF91029.1 LysR family transcriptional regulator [Bradyrhizobium commune]
MKDIFALKLFTRVARLGSFSAAARECNLSQSQASRIVADLEESLGARLLSRTTRAVVPTEAGSEFLAKMEPILDALDEAEQSVREGGELRGTLRLGMPSSMAIREVIPRLTPFAAKYPKLNIQVLLDDKRQDLVREAVDVAIRIGRLTDSSATARLIARITRVIVAAPSYLAQAGMPEVPADLSRHRIIGGPATLVPTAWQFERDGKTETLELSPHLSTNDNEATVAAATAGMGITSTQQWACRRELQSGALVRLMPDWKTRDIPVHAYFPAGRATRAAARALIDFLAGEFRREEEQATKAAKTD